MYHPTFPYIYKKSSEEVNIIKKPLHLVEMFNAPLTLVKWLIVISTCFHWPECHFYFKDSRFLLKRNSLPKKKREKKKSIIYYFRPCPLEMIHMQWDLNRINRYHIHAFKHGCVISYGWAPPCVDFFDHFSGHTLF